MEQVKLFMIRCLEIRECIEKKNVHKQGIFAFLKTIFRSLCMLLLCQRYIMNLCIYSFCLQLWHSSPHTVADADDNQLLQIFSAARDFALSIRNCDKSGPYSFIFWYITNTLSEVSGLDKEYVRKFSAEGTNLINLGPFHFSLVWPQYSVV